MFTRILVALDGSHFSEQAIPIAELLARRFGAGLSLVTVHEPSTGIEAESWDRSVSAWSEEYVEALAEEVGTRSGLATSGHMVVGSPLASLVGHADRAKCDLIVAATHGRGALSRAWLGSVADGLLRASKVPVLLVRPDDDPAAAAPESEPFGRILVPLDGSDFSCTILRDALPLARAFDASIDLIRVVPFPMEIASPYLPTTVQMNREVVESAKAAAETWLEARAAEVRAEGIECRTGVRVATQPARAISESADELGADLIVMATHGRRGLGRMLLGSTADKVVRTAHVPVLVHRPSDPA